MSAALQGPHASLRFAVGRTVGPHDFLRFVVGRTAGPHASLRFGDGCIVGPHASLRFAGRMVVLCASLHLAAACAAGSRVSLCILQAAAFPKNDDIRALCFQR